MRQRALAIGLGLLLLLPRAQPSAPVNETRATEWEVKALFLLNFTKYVEWPPQRIASANPMIVCAPATSPLPKILQQLVKENTVPGRRVEILTATAENLVQCHTLFRGVADPRPSPETSLALQRAGVLLVGDSADFLQSGGMIRLVVDGGRMRFDVDLDAVRAAGLQISAQLLRLARTVRGVVKA